MEEIKHFEMFVDTGGTFTDCIGICLLTFLYNRQLRD